MPTYDYKCTDCGHTFEHFQSISEEKLKVCPKCNGELIRLIGAGSSPIFKGSGFYQTDYKAKQSSTGKSESKSGPSKSGKK